MEEAIGRTIQQLRTDAGIGLRELSRMAEVSPASLTSIEKGLTSPTLATLHKILKALGTNFTDFFANSQPEFDEPVFSSKQMRTAADAYREYTFILPRRNDMRFQMLYEIIAASEKEPEWELHDCDVGGFILAGGPAKLEIKGIGQWKLKKGDSFYIKAKCRHRLINAGKRSLKQITVMDPPKY